MANKNNIKRIFISYSWANETVADEIDGYFKSIGITLERDTRDVGYRQSIKEFMKRIKEADFVLMIISKDFLESENCMYEAMEIFEDENFRKRFLPIVLDDAKIFKASGRIKYIKHWEIEHRKLEYIYKDVTLMQISAIVYHPFRFKVYHPFR